MKLFKGLRNRHHTDNISLEEIRRMAEVAPAVVCLTCDKCMIICRSHVTEFV